MTTDMKLFFDARYIRTDFHDGISRYSVELGNALAKLTPVTFIICDPAQLKFLPKNAQCIVIHRPTSVREPLTARILNAYGPDIVFSPMQTMGSRGRTFKLILTLHDMIYYHHRTPPHNMHPIVRAGWYGFHLTYGPQRLLLNGADAVATVSQTSKNEIAKARLTKRAITVIPNAARDLKSFLASAPRHNHDGPKNLIYMGAFMPYKNVETLIEGMKWLPDHTLHLLSKISPGRKAQLRSLAPTGAKIIFHEGVSDEQYAHLLAANAVLVTASLNEGYALPIAEALALGVPAVVSEIPVFHEVAGPGALYFNPYNPKDFANKVQQLSSPELVKKLSSAGKAHTKQSSWEKSAQILLDLARSLS